MIPITPPQNNTNAYGVGCGAKQGVVSSATVTLAKKQLLEEIRTIEDIVAKQDYTLEEKAQIQYHLNKAKQACMLNKVKL